MGTTDIFLLVFIVSVLITGFFWGALRSLMLLATWLFAFLAGAYLQVELGAYLASQWTDFLASFSTMAAYGIIYVGVLVAAPFFIYAITRSTQRVTRYQVLDDFVGAFFAVFVAVLSIAGVMIILSTYYGTGTDTEIVIVSAAGGPAWTATLYEDLLNSNIGSGIAETLIPIIGFVLGPILPPDVREVFG
jgi:uncharacterized membrane protein required for colicin V production